VRGRSGPDRVNILYAHKVIFVSQVSGCFGRSPKYRVAMFFENVIRRA
jgi:hypothetical protein